MEEVAEVAVEEVAEETEDPCTNENESVMNENDKNDLLSTKANKGGMMFTVTGEESPFKTRLLQNKVGNKGTRHPLGSVPSKRAPLSRLRTFNSRDSACSQGDDIGKDTSANVIKDEIKGMIEVAGLTHIHLHQSISKICQSLIDELLKEKSDLSKLSVKMQLIAQDLEHCEQAKKLLEERVKKNKAKYDMWTKEKDAELMMEQSKVERKDRELKSLSQDYDRLKNVLDKLQRSQAPSSASSSVVGGPTRMNPLPLRSKKKAIDKNTILYSKPAPSDMATLRKENNLLKEKLNSLEMQLKICSSSDGERCHCADDQKLLKGISGENSSADVPLEN